MKEEIISLRFLLILIDIGLFSISGLSQAKNLSQNEYTTISRADIMPVFPGCEQGNATESERCTTVEIAHFIRENLSCPLMAGSRYYNSTSNIYFEIGPDGWVQNVKAFPENDKQLDQAAINAVRQLPQFTPGQHQRKACIVNYSIPVRSTSRCIKTFKSK